jgi:redox-sensitive bicupin YhaK (pirin superfamily)
MIAGSGITHSERFERARAHGGSVHGIQSWIALTREQEECEPQFQHHGRESLPSFEQGGARARLIAGEAYGLRAPVKTFSPLFYLHWELPPDSSASVPRGATERAVYVVAGRIDLGGRRFGAGQLLVLSPGADVRVTAIGPAVVMTLGGEPVGPRFIEWNFVSSSQERIAQAKADWRAGRMLLPLHDDTEFIPLPPDPPPSGQPL